jgi:hypothetical protein
MRGLLSRTVATLSRGPGKKKDIIYHSIKSNCRGSRNRRSRARKNDFSRAPKRSNKKTTTSLLLLFFYCAWACKQETFSRARIYPRDGCDSCDAGAVIFKNQWLACMLRAKCGCGSDATVATVGFTLVLVGAVVLAKNFEGRAKRLAPSRRGTVLRDCLGGAPFEAI